MSYWNYIQAYKESCFIKIIYKFMKNSMSLLVNNKVNKIMTDNEHFTMHKSLTRFTSGNTNWQQNDLEVVVQYYNKEFIYYLHKTYNK
jgi:hypothetical protein